MINYIKSEHYRLLRKKNLYTITIVGFLLIAAAAAVLYYYHENEPTFPYGTSTFYYSNVIAAGLIIIIVGFLFNLALTGKDTALIKQSISFGISRQTIFWSKLCLTLSYFLLVCVLGLFLTIMLGENLLVSDNQPLSYFIIASINMIPIVMSGFLIIHVLSMLKVGQVYIVIILLFIFSFSGDLLRMLLRSFPSLNGLYHYAPSTLLNENLMNFVNEAPQLGYRYWLTSIVISVICLWIGTKRFTKQNID